MRELKFRAKIKAHDFEQKLALINKPQNEGEWAYGEIHVNSKIPHIHVGPYRYPIDIETIGQYTGLKDKNGKEIYEGDIIRSFDSNGEAILHCIVWGEAMFVALYKGRNFSSKCFLKQDWLDEFDKEVIGNIHDNKEYLEE